MQKEPHSAEVLMIQPDLPWTLGTHLSLPLSPHPEGKNKAAALQSKEEYVPGLGL